MAVTETAGRVEVVRVGAEHLPALTEFYRQVWDPGATVETVQASRAAAADSNQVAPGEPPATWLVLQQGRAIAHVTTIPIALWMEGRERAAYWIKGLWVLPEFQRSSAGFLALREAAKLSEPTLALVHEPAAIRLFQALGFADLGSLPNELRSLRPHVLLARLDIDRLGLDGMPAWLRSAARLIAPAAPILAPVVGAVNALWAAVASGPRGGFTVETSPECDREGADELWRSVRTELGPAPARTGSQLARRYGLGGEYLFVHIRSASRRLVGLGIVKRPREQGDPRLAGIRISTLSDILYRPSEPQVGLAVLRGAEHAARGLGGDALLSSASGAAIAPLLRRRGYVPLPRNLRVLARVPRPEVVPPRLDEWWITRGDSGGDGVF